MVVVGVLFRVRFIFQGELLMSVTPQTVLVTGTSSGIGRGIAETLARHGHNVFATMRNVNGKNAAAAQEINALAQKENLSLQVVEMDVTDDDSVTNAVQTVLDKAGGIDVLVNNAGIMTIGVSEAFSVKQMQNMFDVNVFGAFRVAQAVLPHMRDRGAGYLVYTSSASSLVVFPFIGLYGASKGAMSLMAQGLHYDVFSLGIDTTIFQCGAYVSDLTSNYVLAERSDVAAQYGMVSEMANKTIENTPKVLIAGVAGDPSEIGNTIADLMTRPSSERPLHLPIGLFSEPLPAVNEVMSVAQAQILSTFQQEALIKRPELA
jgi:NAD(P)-dependent dehydrogenase (short-subunit alcohol dehydrogenase family)